MKRTYAYAYATHVALYERGEARLTNFAIAQEGASAADYLEEPGGAGEGDGARLVHVPPLVVRGLP